MTSNQECPFEEGDRVDHRIFGLGTVDGAPVAVVGPDMRSASGISEAGWSIPVRWDDAERTAGSVMHVALRKIESPDSRPFGYWDRQWQPLLKTWLTARREVEAALAGFRPAPESADMARVLDAERKAFEAMQRFWEQERAGEHP